MAPCIYPGPHGEMSPEHYMPVALGTFQGCEPLQNRVCGPCNTHIGNQAETQFLRAGPIAFFRWMLGIEGEDGPPPSPFSQGAAGAPRLAMLGRAPDAPYDILWEVAWGSDRPFPLRQIVFDSHLAGIHPIPITDRMRDNPEVLVEYLREQGLSSGTPIRVFADAADVPWVRGLLRAIGAQAPDEWTMTDYPPERRAFVTMVSVTDAHFRAVAKIAFHYTLRMFPELNGQEDEFARIRGFIWDGSGNSAGFVRQLPYQVVRNFQRQRPTHWMHILAVHRSYDAITAYAQFFLGSRSLPPPYHIRLGRDPARIERRPEWRAHYFVITNPGSSRGPIGLMDDAQPANLVLPPWA